MKAEGIPIMKRISTLLLFIVLSLNSNAQERIGYITHHAEYSEEEDEYNSSSVSGIGYTFERRISDENKEEFLRVGEITELGNRYSYYKIVDKFIGDDQNKYILYILEDAFGNSIGFKYTEDNFIVLYNYDKDYLEVGTGKVGLWRNFYVGDFLNKQKNESGNK
jgi:hypothetical protein